MSQPGGNHRDGETGASLSLLLFCAFLGAVFFYLVGFTYGRVSAITLPAPFLDLWSRSPLLGSLLVNALTSVLIYWLVAAAIGLAIAATARNDPVFYGAVATGVFLMLTATTDYDGWQAFVEVGADFWLALRTDAVLNDPFGTLGRWFSLPVCAWLWSKTLSAGTSA